MATPACRYTANSSITIIGMVHIKDVFANLAPARARDDRGRSANRYYVPQSRGALDLLARCA